jgi:hypothetical protein
MGEETITPERYEELRSECDPTEAEARELAAHWRENADDPGFMQPPKGLVDAVEVKLGLASVWDEYE